MLQRKVRQRGKPKKKKKYVNTKGEKAFYTVAEIFYGRKKGK